MFQNRKPGDKRMGDAIVVGDVTLSEEDEEQELVMDIDTKNNSDSESDREAGEDSDVLVSVERKSKNSSPVWEAGGKQTNSPTGQHSAQTQEDS